MMVLILYNQIIIAFLTMMMSNLAIVADNARINSSLVPKTNMMITNGEDEL